MKIKTKLALSLTLLFALTIALAGLAIWQVRQLASDTGNILVANYQSLEYSRNMYSIIDKGGTDFDPKKFKDFLDKQLKNITEVGEQEFTTALKEDFDAYVLSPTPAAAAKIRADLNSLMKINMDAIKRKSLRAEATAEQSILWLSFTSCFCLIVGFTLLINIPGYIANPIRELTESIRQIAAKNYSQRVRHQGSDEFATLAKSFNTMAEKLEEYSNSNLEKLMMEKRRVETLISNLNDPVIGLDDKNKILFINDEAIKISGLQKDKVLGRQAEQVAIYNDLIRSLLQQHEKTNGKHHEPIKIYADGKESYFEKYLAPISIIPTGETQPKAIGSFIILKNITAYKELDFAKTSFIATVSHEFKTPIASMKMSLQLLGNEHTGTLNEEQKALVGSINDDTDRLLRTTGELLNITQVETGKTAINIESADTEAVIADAIEANKAASSAKHIVIINKIPTGFPDIIADTEKATWIVSNLLSNAIRYSHDDSEIEISSELTENSIFISVKDNGIGIPAEHLPKVFDKYFRVPGTKKEGTGLGLAISKEFMEAQGGEITVESAPGLGSTFTLRFKRAF